MKTIGNGLQTKSQGESIILVRKYFTNARKGQLNFIKRPEGDLEQSELGFEFSLLMVIPKADDSAHSIQRQNYCFVLIYWLQLDIFRSIRYGL
jgi:hypothetical protein